MPNTLTDRLRLLKWREILPRVSVDSVLVVVSLALAFSLRYTIYLLSSEDLSRRVEIFSTLSGKFFFNLVPVVAICICTFAVFGFYTKGRAYRGRYKALIILQALVVASLLLNTFAYLIQSEFLLPRGVIVFHAGFLVLFIGGARLAKKFLLLYFQDAAEPTAEPAMVKKVLVIGGAGHLGSKIVRLLLDSGYSVRVLDMLMFGAEPIREVAEDPNFELFTGDFRLVNNLVRAVKDVDAVIHMGAIVGDPACALDSDYTIDVNFLATRMICDVCQGAGVKRFLFASTCSVYGASDEILDERSLLNPVSLYARTKIDAERAILSKGNAEFAPTILRLATVFGLSPRPRFDLVVNLCTAMAVTEGHFKIFGGDQWRPFVHVADVARGFLAVLEASAELVNGEIFNVGSDDMNYQLRDVGDLIQESVPEATCDRIEEDVDRRNYRVSFSKIRNHIGFQHTKTLQEGIVEIRNALRSGLVERFRDSAYSNYAHLQQAKGAGSDQAYEPLQYLAGPGTLSAAEDEYAREALLREPEQPDKATLQPKVKFAQ